jgi:hypothetical protein
MEARVITKGSVQEDRMQKTLRGKGLNDVFEFACSLFLVALALLGMTGLIYHALSPDGLIGPWVARLWSSHPGFTSLVAVGLATMILAARGNGHRVSSSDLPLYFFVALGTFFAARWLVNGMF